MCHKKGSKSSVAHSKVSVFLMPFQEEASSISAFSTGTYVTSSWFSYVAAKNTEIQRTQKEAEKDTVEQSEQGSQG